MHQQRNKNVHCQEVYNIPGFKRDRFVIYKQYSRKDTYDRKTNGRYPENAVKHV